MKGYLITFVRLLLGIDAEENSGHLSSVSLLQSNLYSASTYGTIKICLLKTGACLLQVHFNVLACFGIRIHASLIQVACLIEVATKTGLTVYGHMICQC